MPQTNRIDTQIWQQKTGSICRPICETGRNGISQLLGTRRNFEMTQPVTKKLLSRKIPKCHLSSNQWLMFGSMPVQVELQRQARNAMLKSPQPIVQNLGKVRTGPFP